MYGILDVQATGKEQVWSFRRLPPIGLRRLPMKNPFDFIFPRVR
jgi:hypothetical protein